MEQSALNVCTRPRGGGKTQKVLQWAVQKLWNNEDFVVVSHNTQESNRLYDILEPFGAKTDNFCSVTAAAMIRARRCAFALDNYDLMNVKPAYFCGRPIELVTITGNPI